MNEAQPDPPSLHTTRRAVLRAAGVLAGGLLVPVLAARGQGAAPFAPNAFIRIDSQGQVTLVMPMVEMGQGIYTALAMLLAEELEVDVERVRLEHAPPNDALYGNQILHVQTTGLSASVRAFWQPLRVGGASARMLLVAAAAARWQVEPGSCQAQQGAVRHAATSRVVEYGALAEAAAALPLPKPESVSLKRPEEFRLIGTPLRRLEGSEKVNGRAAFGIDARPPGLKYAAVALSPAFGGSLATLDEAAALAVKGVRQVVRLDDVVAVVADHTGAAKKGLAAAAPRWNAGPNDRVANSDIERELETASRQPGAVARNVGDTVKAMATAARRVEAIYRAPFLAHAAMEPMNCTVHLTKDGCDLWVGTQAPTLTQATVARLTGLQRDAVRVHGHLLGGGFGRRLDVDGTVVAVRLAQKVDGPVKFTWSREEDLQHDMYRPFYFDHIAAGLDARGAPVAWTHRIAGSSVIARYVPPLFKNGIDPDAVECAADLPYALPNLLVDYVRVEPPGIPTAFWRGVGPTHNVFVVESFIDELAAVARQDPLAYRRRQLTRNPRALAVLDLAAKKARWGRRLAARRGLGLSVQHAFGTYLAQAAEVEVHADGSVRVHRIWCAVDCGLVINPDTVAAQMEGGTLFGLTAALYGAITVKDGRVEQSNFHDYMPLRMNEAPTVETHIVKNTEAPGGIGETATAAVAPAVANAIFAATGHRIRTLPINAAAAALTVGRAKA